MKKEFLKRLISSLILIPLIVFLIFKGSFFLNLFLLICLLISCYEWHLMTKLKSYYFYGFIFLTFSFYTAYEINNLENNRNLFYDVLKRISKSCFVPITVGGYINDVEEITKFQNLGADKILVTFIILALCIELSSVFIGMVGGLMLVREFWVGALRDFNARQGTSDSTKVSFLAKIKTTIQFITFSFYLIGLLLNNSLILFLSNFLLFLSLIITLQTGLSYTIATFKR